LWIKFWSKSWDSTNLLSLFNQSKNRKQVLLF
jgi:hypothetical protein